MDINQGRITLKPVIHNRGGAVAKYCTVIGSIIGDPLAYRIVNAEGWSVRPDQKSCQFATGFNTVIYPRVPSNTGTIHVQREPGMPLQTAVVFSFMILAEDMDVKQVMRDYMPELPAAN